MHPEESLPSRERGLKCQPCGPGQSCPGVAPFTGAWIEIRHMGRNHQNRFVAPFTGAWIEIQEFVDDGSAEGRSLHGSVD